MAEEAWRAATVDDLPRLDQLVAQAITEQIGQKGGEVWSRTAARRPPFGPRLEHELAAPDHHLLVGTLDGTILGYGAAHIDDLADGGRLGVVTDLYVEPAGREVGIGEAIMDGLVAWCTDEGCFGVDSLALPGDRHTKNFFETFGLVARAIVVHRTLP
jgi:GNAT superfamily N-acetyltransferase